MFVFDKVKNPKKFVLMPGQMSETKESLEAGVYNLSVSGGGMSPLIVSFDKTTKYDEGMTIEGGVFTQANTTFDKFVLPEMYEARTAMNMMHKIGVVFDGKPGTGKTFLAGQIASKFAKEHNAIGIISTQHRIDYPGIIDSIRELDKERLIVLVMDEFEKSQARYQSEMLSFLDGTDSKENMIVIATINDISEMPSYLKDRPGRFENILKFRSDDQLILKSIVSQCIPDIYKNDFVVDDLVKEFTSKSNANKFGLKNERDDFTVDRLRVVIRDLIADKIKANKTVVETVTVDVKAQVELATKAMEPVAEVADEQKTTAYKSDLTPSMIQEFFEDAIETVKCEQEKEPDFD